MGLILIDIKLILIDAYYKKTLNPTFIHKISCMCVQVLFNSFIFFFSPQKPESVHDKRRNVEAVTLSCPTFYGDLSSSKYVKQQY